MRVPEFEFIPVVNPYVGAPIEEFGDTVNKLGERYDTAIIEEGKLQSALNAIQNAPFDGDREMLNKLKSDFLEKRKAREEAGDYENQLVNVRRDAIDFTNRSQPIMQQQEAWSSFVNDINNRDDIADKSFFINEAKKGQGLQYDEETEAITNKFVAPSLAGDVDPFDIMNKAASGIKEQLLELGYIPKVDEYGQVKYLDKVTNKYVDPKVVNNLAEVALESNPKFKAWLQREVQYGRGEEALNIVNNAKDSIIKKYSYVKQITSRVGEPGYNAKSSSGSGFYGVGSSIPLINEDIFTTSLDNQILELDEQLKNVPDGSNEKSRLLINKELRLNLKDRIGDANNLNDAKLLSNYSNKTDKEIKEIVDKIKMRLVNSQIIMSQIGETDQRKKEINVLRKKLERINRVRQLRKKDYKILEKNGIFNSSYAPSVYTFSNPESETAEALTNFVNNAYQQFDYINQSGESLETLIDELTKKDKQYLKDVIGKDVTNLSDIMPFLKVIGVTKEPMIGKNQMAVYTTLGSKFRNIFGEKIYAIPRVGVQSGVFDKVADEMKNDGKNIDFKFRINNPNVIDDVDSKFNEIRRVNLKNALTKPNQKITIIDKDKGDDGYLSADIIYTGKKYQLKLTDEYNEVQYVDLTTNNIEKEAHDKYIAALITAYNDIQQ